MPPAHRTPAVLDSEHRELATDAKEFRELFALMPFLGVRRAEQN